jgi:hypothetical protein
MELFFKTAIPVAHQLSTEQAVLWWAWRGELFRIQMNIHVNELDVDMVEPNTPAMDELLRACSPDELCDAIAVSHKLAASLAC